MLRIFKQYYPVRNVFFVIGECVAIYLSVLFATWILLGGEFWDLSRFYSRKAILITAVCQVCLYYNGLYDFRIVDSFVELGIRLLQALGASAIFLAIIYILFPGAIISRGIFVVSIGFAILLIVAWRFGYHLILKRGIFNQNIVILGSGDLAEDIISEIKEKKDCGYTVSKILPECRENEDTAQKNQIARPYKTIGPNYAGLCETAKDLKIKKIVVALKEKRGEFPIKELLNCRVQGIDVLEGNSFYEKLSGKLNVKQVNPGWLIFSDGFRTSLLKRFLKRTSDTVIASVLLILLSPLFLVTAVLIKIDSRGPVFFSQERVGQRRKPYIMHKFRSMVTDAELKSGPVWAKDQDDRVTRVGRFIRKWRIDEIPQLWNVLKGEMSFVGPRPEREFFVNELEKMIPYYGNRFIVKPGVTGWAQVSYGYGASVEDAIEKLNYDLFYIKNMSIFMDLMIVLRTVRIVVFGIGAR